MMDDRFPDSVLRIAEAAADEHPDVTSATDAAVRAVEKDPAYATFVAQLVRRAVKTLVERRRHAINVELKKKAGLYGGPAKVNPVGTAVQDAYAGHYAYCIGNRRLGDILGNDLLFIAANERARADGFIFRARLCEELRRLVPDGQRVRDRVSVKELDDLFARLQRAREGQVA